MWPFKPRPRKSKARLEVEQLVRATGKIAQVPTTNIENWTDERLRWAIERMLDIIEPRE